jgi:type VI secretion system protein ImpC
LSKYFPFPFPEKFRSRLMLHYRTNITGTPVPVQLPFRVLVLGKLTCETARKQGLIPAFEARRVRSIRFGTVGAKVDDLMADLQPWMKLPSSVSGKLGSKFEGALSVTFEGEIPGDLADDTPITVELESVEGSFQSKPENNGFTTLEGRKIRARARLQIKQSAGALAADGDLTFDSIVGVAKGDVHDDLQRRTGVVVGLVSSSTAVAKDKVTLTKDDSGSGAPPKKGFKRIKVVVKDWATKADRVLPLTSLTSFSPDEVAKAIPTLHRLGVVRGLVLTLQSQLRNVQELRNQMKTAISEQQIAHLQALQEWASAAYPLLKVTEADGVTASPPALTPLAGDPLKLQDSLLKTVGGRPDALTKEDNQVLKAISFVERVGTEGFRFRDRDTEMEEGARLMNALAAFLVNLDLIRDDYPTKKPATADIKAFRESGHLADLSDLHDMIGLLTARIDATVKSHLDVLLHDPEFRELEHNWRAINTLASAVSQEDVVIDLLDVDKEELRQDLADNDTDLFSSTLFNRIYVDEYDRYGGNPFATMVGLYEFNSEKADVSWLHTMAKIAASAHCPFLGSVGPSFFRMEKVEDVAAVTDLDAVLNSPKLGHWNALRDEDHAAYIGLTFPRYIVRQPWGASGGDAEHGNRIGYEEAVAPGAPAAKSLYLWGTSAVLFAKNIIRSYERSGWAQHIRGPKGGGIVEGMEMPAYIQKEGRALYGKAALTESGGQEQLHPPVEVAIPDHREYQFSRNGIISLVHRKGEAVATFFGAQSIKKPKDFLEDVNTKNAYLVTNLAYTYSITRIAHYVKAMMREYIGSTADDKYIQQTLESWLSGFVTTVTNPDDLTLLYYPFKATSVTVEPKPGPFGWYKAVVSILPHLQFEGMDVELRLEAALGGSK